MALRVRKLFGTFEKRAPGRQRRERERDNNDDDNNDDDDNDDDDDDDDEDSSYTNNDDFNTLTFGANYYMHGHAAKFTVDLQYFLDDSADNDIVSANNDIVSANSGIGLLTDSDDGEIGIRAQFQLLF